MNENLNLVEILKECPKGTKLYSPIAGEVKLEVVHLNRGNSFYPIEVTYNDEGAGLLFTKEGLYRNDAENGECLLFPSKDQRDWSKFKPKKPKFDPKTLQPFDRVLARDANDREWLALLFSHVNIKGKCNVAGCIWGRVVPYNDDTKHLVGTTKEAPEFYRHWEE